MRYFIKILIFLLIGTDVLYANPSTQDVVNRLDEINSVMQNTIIRCKQVEDRNKDDDVDLDFINKLFQQNNKNIQIYLNKDTNFSEIQDNNDSPIIELLKKKNWPTDPNKLSEQ